MKNALKLRALALSFILPASAFAGTSGTVSVVNQPGPVIGQPGGGTQQSDITAEDRMVLQEMHQGNLFEIKAALVAFDKDTTKEAREYAWKVIDAHIAIEKSLQIFANTHDISLVSNEVKLVESGLKYDQLVSDLKEAEDKTFAIMFATSFASSHAARLTELAVLSESTNNLELDALIVKSINAIRSLQTIAIPPQVTN